MVKSLDFIFKTKFSLIFCSNIEKIYLLNEWKEKGKRKKKKKAKEENVVETRNKNCDGVVCIFCLLVKIEIVTVVKAVTFIVDAAAMIDVAMIDMIPTVDL